jgi:hypothetical protein
VAFNENYFIIDNWQFISAIPRAVGVDRHQVEVVQFLPTLLYGDDQIGLVQNPQALADRLPRYVEARAEFAKRWSMLAAGNCLTGRAPITARPRARSRANLPPNEAARP